MSNILSIRLREEDKLLKEFFDGIKKKDKSFWARLLMEEALQARMGGNSIEQDNVLPFNSELPHIKGLDDPDEVIGKLID